MKYKVKPLFYILIFIYSLLSSGNQLFGQEKINMSLGIGFPEFINVGIRYQLKQTQLGFGFGYMPIIGKIILEETDNKMISILSDFIIILVVTVKCQKTSLVFTKWLDIL